MGNPFGEIYNQGDSSSVDNTGSGVQGGGQAQGTGYNPNFQPLLNDVPQDLHDKILPHLQQWDKGVNERFEQLQSTYAPWKGILNSGATPDMLQNGLNILNLLERDPESLFKALKDNYQFDQQQQQVQAGQGQSSPPQQAPTEPDPYSQYDARFQQVDQNFQTLAQHVLDMRHAEENAAMDAAIASEFATAHKKLGAFDDNWVRAYCIADPNLSIEQAAQNYQSWHRSELAKHGARPLISGSSGSGGVPGNTVDVTKLSGQQTRGLVADMIRAAKAANQ